MMGTLLLPMTPLRSIPRMPNAALATGLQELNLSSGFQKPDFFSTHEATAPVRKMSREPLTASAMLADMHH